MTQPTLRTGLRRSLPRFIGWFFGTFWALLAASSLPRPCVRAGSAFAMLIALLFLARLWKNQPATANARPFFNMTVYSIAVAAELLGMYTAALVLPRFGALQQVYPAIGCIVGLHFIGLWLATGSPQFLRITVGMCIVSLLSMLMPFTWHNIGVRYLLLGAGNSMVLWFAASGTE